MSIKTRLTLIGALAVAGLSVLLLGLLADEYGQYREQRQLAEDIHLISAHAAVVHELQRERGLSAGFMADRDAALKDRLAAQRQRSDRSLLELYAGDPALFGNVTRQLKPIRKAIDEGTASYPEEYRAYSRLIRDRLDQVRSLGRQTAPSPLKNDLVAHSHLMFVKEFLGRTRATVFHGLRMESRGSEVTGEAAHLQALFGEYRHLLHRDADAELVSRVETALANPDGRAVLESLAATARGDPANADASEAAWFGRSTRVIDRLKRIEEASLNGLVDQSERQLAELKNRLLVFATVALLLGGGIIVLVLYTIHHLVRALRDQLGEIRRIGEQQDFSARLADRSQPHELGVIARSFNGLLSTVERLLAEQKHLAGTDQLTQLCNRRCFDDTMAHAIARSQRRQTPLSLLMLDIDHFKSINDRFGHTTGDQVLEALTRLLSDHLRAADIASRWGGEEFAVLLPDTDGNGARELAEKLRVLVEQHTFPEIGPLTISLGVGILSDEANGEDMLREADNALYRAKRAGRNRVEGPD